MILLLIIILVLIFGLILLKNKLFNIYLFFYKWLDIENLSFFGYYYNSEIIMLHSKLYIESGYFPDLVFIQRYEEHYDLYFLLRCKRHEMTLHRVPFGHSLRYFPDDNIGNKEIIHSPYEKHTPFKLRSGSIGVHRKERTGKSLMFVDKQVSVGKNWPISTPLSVHDTNSFVHNKHHNIQ